MFILILMNRIHFSIGELSSLCFENYKGENVETFSERLMLRNKLSKKLEKNTIIGMLIKIHTI